MSARGTVAVVAAIPPCDICKQAPAAVDGRTVWRAWANMCVLCHSLYGFGLGVGNGQRLVLASSDRSSDG